MFTFVSFFALGCSEKTCLLELFMTLSLEMKWLTINLLTQKYPAESGLEKEKLTKHSGLEMFFFCPETIPCVLWAA